MAEEWSIINRELLEETEMEDEVMFWMRAGGFRSKDTVSMTWNGDQNTDWTRSDGLKSSIVCSLSLALGGIGLTHNDIGGYTNTPILGTMTGKVVCKLQLVTAFLTGINRNKELLLRWAEYAVFTPVMRTHEGSHPKSNHQVYDDEDTMTKFGRLTNIFSSLYDYHREAIRQVLEWTKA